MPFGAIGRTLSQQRIRTLGKDANFSTSDSTSISEDTFGYTGGNQTFSISSNVSIPTPKINRASAKAYAVDVEVKAWGASGGGGGSNCFGPVNTCGGNGGFVDASEAMYKQVLGNLKTLGQANVTIPGAFARSWNVVVGEGGLQGRSRQNFGGGGGCPGNRESRSGGGASWIATTYPTTAAPQLLVVAGGGAGSGRSIGGSGGADGQGPGGPGTGGGASFLQGNNGDGPDGSGGGGGFSGGTGGGGDGGDCRGLGGAGGTSYISPALTDINTNGITNQTPGSGTTVTWSNDPDYANSAGQGTTGAGQPGRVVVKVSYG